MTVVILTVLTVSIVTVVSVAVVTVVIVTYFSKNTSHGRHQISRPMRIEAPIIFLLKEEENQSGTPSHF